MASAVSLPSIQEGFPDIDFREPPLPGSYPAVRLPVRDELASVIPSHAPHARARHSPTAAAAPTPYQRPSYHSPSIRESRSHSRTGSGGGGHPEDELTYSPRRYYPHSTAHFAPRGPGPSSVSQQQQQSSPHANHPKPAAAAPPPGVPKSQQYNHHHHHPKPSPGSSSTYSFDVLRSEPGTISLEHIASSKTLQNRGSSAPKAISPTGVANGSAPAFRVALPASAQQQVMSSSGRAERAAAGEVGAVECSLYSSLAGPGGPCDFDGQQPNANVPPPPPSEPSEPSSLLSFSITDPAADISKPIDVSGRSSYYQETTGGGIFRVDGRGKKHQCPQCPKRFNRPSSLRIHVNTHTGARPFQCPYPRCGREFNVNSNMRRHYRNHSIAITAEVHPPRHNSGRRPRGYPREHPGRASRTVFHVSPGHLGRAGAGREGGGLSPSSLTEDDSMGSGEEFFEGGGMVRVDVFDEEDGSERGGGGDEEDEEDDDDGGVDRMEYTLTHRVKSATWSPPPSSPTSHTRTRLIYDDPQPHTGTRPAAAPCSTTTTTTSSPPRLSHPSSFSRSGYTYTPSSPAFAQACRDSTVSTTLRPAFR